MAARKRLRAVSPDEAPTTLRRYTITEAVERGNQRDQLIALRDRVAKTVEDPNCPPRDLAALTRRLQDIAKEIEAIDLRAKEEGADAADVAADEDWSAEAL